MICNDNIYITLSIFLIIFLLFINSNSCVNNNINIIEGFRNNYTYGLSDKDTSKYLFVCVDDDSNLNQYYVPGDGSLWSNAVQYAENRWSMPQPGYIKEVDTNSTWSQSSTSNPVKGILCYDNNLTIFSNMKYNPNHNKDSSNSYGNRRSAVLILLPELITAPNFQGNCTKEDWYLFREQSGRHYIYAVFKRKPWTNDLTCCTNNSIQRNSCNDLYININGDKCNDYMRNYCNTNDNIQNNICNTWCNNPNNKSYCNQYKTNYCSTTDNILNSYDFCRNWCKSDIAGNMCENNIINYCNNNPNDFDLCSCMELNNQYNLPQEMLNDPTTKDLKPICWSKRCAEKGYITSNMKILKSTCPTCYQKLVIDNIKANNVNISDLVQTCQSESNINTAINTTKPTPTKPTPTKPTPVQPTPVQPTTKQSTTKQSTTINSTKKKFCIIL